jgi:hypothetical protein
MVAGGYIAVQTIYWIIEVTLLVIGMLQFYSGRWVFHKETGRLLKLIHVIVLVSLGLIFFRLFDPDCK